MILIPKDFWEVRHTAEKDRGIFATKIIAPGTVIADYLGTLLPAHQEDKIGPTYTMFFNDDTIIVPSDPSIIGAHVLNHSCVPTCDSFPYKGHILIFALRKIFPGEELTYQYMIDPPADSKKPSIMYPCRCNSVLCNGTMNTTADLQKKNMEFVHMVQQKEHTETVPVPYRNELPKLDSYPSKISDHLIYDLFGSPLKKPLKSYKTSLPNIFSIRNTIRMTGKMIIYCKLGFTLMGIKNGLIISKFNNE